MEDNRIYTIIEILDHWQEQHGEKVSYSFTMDTSSVSRYKLSLYYYQGEYNSIKGAYSLSTSNLDEVLHKLTKGMNSDAHN